MQIETKKSSKKKPKTVAIVMTETRDIVKVFGSEKKAEDFVTREAMEADCVCMIEVHQVY